MTVEHNIANPDRLNNLGGGAYANTPEQRRDASRLVLRHARNRADLQLLLGALGLNTTKEETCPTSPTPSSTS